MGHCTPARPSPHVNAFGHHGACGWNCVTIFRRQQKTVMPRSGPQQVLNHCRPPFRPAFPHPTCWVLLGLCWNTFLREGSLAFSPRRLTLPVRICLLGLCPSQVGRKLQEAGLCARPSWGLAHWVGEVRRCRSISSGCGPGFAGQEAGGRWWPEPWASELTQVQQRAGLVKNPTGWGA